MIPYYDIAKDDVQRITEWFKEVYGIRLSQRQVLEFTINTISIVSKMSVSLEARKIFLAKDRRKVEVGEDIYKRFQLLKDSTTKGSDNAFLMTVLLFQRANTLPVPRPNEPIRKWEQEKTADERRYTQRFNVNAMNKDKE